MKILHNGKAIIVGVENISIDTLPDLKVIGCPMTSTEHLPWSEINERGIKVFSLKGESFFLKYITSTAEHTIGLMIALLRNYKTALKGPYQERETYIGHKLSGKTFGIIGHGRVGYQVKKMAQGLGMLPLSFNTGEPEKYFLETLEKSDVLSLHIPLAGNEGFFTKAMFNSMKPSAYLINTSRGGIIEPGALIWALENKIIAGAAVDFIDDPILLEYANTHNNLILTNHLGGATVEDMAATEEYIINQVNNFIHEN